MDLLEIPALREWSIVCRVKKRRQVEPTNRKGQKPPLEK